MEYTKPTYILFAGVNGAGKSTLYKLLSEYQSLPRINTDEIVRKYGDWRDNSNQIKAGRKAIACLKTYFENSITFNQETTLCGKSILRNIAEARKQGYFIEIHYIGVETVDICKERIKNRVAAGGHGIPDEDVERRYVESIENMRTIFSLCDRVYFYDNTERFTLVAIKNNDILDIRCLEMPKWFRKIVF